MKQVTMILKHGETQHHRVAGHIGDKCVAQSEVTPRIRRSRRSGQDKQANVSFD
jgi:hypothetical protein